MIAADFEYYAPASVKEAVGLLAEHRDAKLLAGGMSLIPALKHRLAQPGVLVDIGRIAELEASEERKGRVRIGARVTHAALNTPGPFDAFPALRDVAAVIGDLQAV